MNLKPGLIMITIEKLKELSLNKNVEAFLNEYNFLDSQNKKMIGLTLLKDGFVLKYYLELKEKDLDNIKKFKEVKKLKNKIAFNIPTSLAVGIKIDNNKNYCDYLHLKFNRNLILKPVSSKIKFLNQQLLKYGMSVEKNNKTKKIKKYFYIFKEKEKVKKLFNLDVSTESVDHFELYEVKNNLKINIIFDFYKDKCVEDFLNKNNLNCFYDSIQIANSFFNKLPIYAGIDKNNNLSIYYSFTNTAYP